MKRQENFWRILFLICLPLAEVLAVLLRDWIVVLIPRMVCPFYAITGWYCPGCGNTRGVIFLLRGDILASMRYNITIVFLTLLVSAFYIENIFALLKKNVKIIPRSNVFLFVTVGIFLLYFALRNFFPYLTP